MSRYDDYESMNARGPDSRRQRSVERYDDRRREDERRPTYSEQMSYNCNDFGRRPYRVFRGGGVQRPQWQQQPRGTIFRGRGNFRGRGRQPLGDTYGCQFLSEVCGKCGLSNHKHPNMCPAINQDCYGCGRKGHFLRVCRTVARMQSNSD